MIPIERYKNQAVGIFGLGRSGVATARALASGGATILAWDDDPDKLEIEGIPVSNLYETDPGILSALVVSPGVPAEHPLVDRARRAGCQLIGDIELFQQTRQTLPAHHLVGVTGTNGKSTTAALLGHVLNRANLPVAVGGNIGTPVFSLDPLPDGGVYVFELSSFQLETTHSLKADVAILLNISADHLDRHGSLEAYAAAKARLFEMQDEEQIAVISDDDEPCRRIAGQLPQQVVPISADRPVKDGVFVLEGRLWDGLAGEEAKPVGDISDCKALQGSHNWQNAAAVYAAGRLLGVDGEVIGEAFRSFPGLPHRLQPVTRARGVLFVNDSKASNPASAANALAAYRDIYWIAGGRLKGDPDLDCLSTGIGHVRRAYLIGECAERFGAFLAGKVPWKISGTVQEAVAAAAVDAADGGGGVILLAPAAASFDQFSNFEERGKAFVSAAHKAAKQIGRKENA